MAAVIDIQTGQRIETHHRPELVLVRGGRDCGRDMARVYLLRRVFVGTIAVAVLLGALLGGRVLSRSPSARASITTTHVVAPGETLWSIARAAQPERDPRHTIADIVDANSKDQGRLDPWEPLSIGQEIRVPLDR